MDTQPPVVTGIYPPPGSTIEQDASFTVSVQDESPLAYRLVLDGWAVMCQTTMGVDAAAGTVTVEFPIEYVGPSGESLRYMLWGGAREIQLEIIDKAGNSTVVGGEYQVDVPMLEQAQADLDAARAQVLADYGAVDGAPVLAWLDLYGLFGAEGGYETHATTYARMETFVDTWDGWDGKVAEKAVFHQEDVDEILGQIQEMMVDYNPSAPNWEVIKDKPWAPVGLMPPMGATVLLAPIVIWALIVGVAAIVLLLCEFFCPDEGKSWQCVVGSISGVIVCAGGLGGWASGAASLAAKVGTSIVGVQLLAGGTIIGGLFAGVVLCMKCLVAALDETCPQCSAF
ncbi:hypothetical protein IIA16_00290 [bacterium]|nr:hypothetical protein [bacterium]